MNPKRKYTLIATSALLLVTLCGCQQSQSRTNRRGDKTRDFFAKATEKSKPTIEWTARRVGTAIGVLAQEALAASEGVIEGWTRPESHPLHLNSATVAEMHSLPGVTEAQAQSIVRNRPYRSKQELLTKARLPEDTYDKIRDRVTAE